MPNNKIIAKKRVKKLFSDIKSIADQPLSDAVSEPSVDYVDSPASQAQQDYQREIKALNARICELETLLTGPETGAKKQEADSSPRHHLPLRPCACELVPTCRHRRRRSCHCRTRSCCLRAP